MSPVLYRLLEAISASNITRHTPDPHLPSPASGNHVSFGASGDSAGSGASPHLTAREKLLLRSNKSKSSAPNTHASSEATSSLTSSANQHHASYLHAQMIYAACVRALDQVTRQWLSIASPSLSQNTLLFVSTLSHINKRYQCMSSQPVPSSVSHHPFSRRPLHSVRRPFEAAWQDTVSPPSQWGIIYTAIARQGGQS